jgi:hypothetical protein
MTPPSYDDIRRQVERRYHKRSIFIYHIIIAFVCLTVIWLTKSPLSMLPQVITVLWIGLLVLHGVKVFMDNARDQALDRMWLRYYDNMPLRDEKPKRDMLHLSDDGELEVIEETANMPNRSARPGEPV